ncbi:MAG: sialate O-acetylesterase [Bacteroidales bacterium]|nr:sialate O-acetylesterase [Candidatus Liminaster caballi]
MKRFLFFLLILMAVSANAAVRLPRLISSNMVLQRADTARIWGWADAGETVTVRFLKKTYSATADDQGRWIVLIPTTQKKMVGGPYTMQINDLQLTDVYVGDVWLCSGQSNMDLHTARLVDLYQQEFKTYSNPAIHLVQLARNPTAEGPKDDVDGHGGFYAWEPLSPEKVGHWSGISYFYAKAMYEATGVPQGIINASMGGSDIVAWCSNAVLEQQAPRYLADMSHLRTPGYLQRNAEINRAVGQAYSRIYEEQDPGLKEQWMNPDFDDSGWETVNQYDQNIGDENGRTWKGSLWFRKTFNVADSLCGREALLRLGCLVDADVCYINGRKVGEIGYQYPPRKYVLAADVLRPGRNVLCIRLKTNGSRDKFVRDKAYKIIFPDDRSQRGQDLMGLTSGKDEIDLEGQYRMHRGVMMPGQPGVEGVNNGKASALYDNMIHPLLNYRISGILWYQGETNAGKPEEYYKLLPAMITDWRKSFGNVPAVIFSLANHMGRHNDPNYGGGWARLRESQRRSVNDLDRAAFVTMIGLGEWNDIHPLNKKEAARRCALQMRSLRGEKLSSEGPAYESVRFEGNKAIVTFRDGTDRLSVVPAHEELTSQGRIKTDGKQILGFKIAGADRRWQWAVARIIDRVVDGKTVGQEIELTADGVQNPVAVRYAWDDDPIATLCGENGLPAVPFTTEQKY